MTHLRRLAFALTIAAALATALPLGGQGIGTAFTYQGRLTDAGIPANAGYDLQFTLYDAATNGNVVGSAINKTNVLTVSGVFTVLLDFGAVFTGNARWLEVAVRPGNSGGSFTTITPRQQLTPTPHALFSLVSGNAQMLGGQLPSAFATQTDLSTLQAAVPQLTGTQTFSGANTFSNVGNTFVGQFTGDLKLASSTAACDSAAAGSVRYSSTQKLLEYCDGASWIALIPRRAVSVSANPPGPSPCSNIGYGTVPVALNYTGGPALVTVYANPIYSPSAATVFLKLSDVVGDLGFFSMVFTAGPSTQILNWTLAANRDVTGPVYLSCYGPNGASVGTVQVFDIRLTATPY